MPLDYKLFMIDAAPKACVPCRLCNSKDDMYLEWPARGDWWERGLVVRIGCGCQAALDSDDKDHARTNFLPPDEAIRAWNEMWGD